MKFFEGNDNMQEVANAAVAEHEGEHHADKQMEEDVANVQGENASGESGQDGGDPLVDASSGEGGSEGMFGGRRRRRRRRSSKKRGGKRRKSRKTRRSRRRRR